MTRPTARLFVVSSAGLFLLAACEAADPGTGGSGGTGGEGGGGGAQSACGDGAITGEELCDGTDLGGRSCADLGFAGGTLSCDPVTCQLDASACTPATSCGNGVAEGGESCDGVDLAGADCATVPGGYVGGTLGCHTNCTFDLSACTPGLVCGNDVTEAGEECDGTDLAAADCTTVPGGFTAGALSCDLTCAFDTSGCTTCGDGVAETGEACDGVDLMGVDCITLGEGHDGGTLACATDCSFDTSGCTWPPLCGDDLAEFPEDCDGTDLNGLDCSLLGVGFVGGVLTCTSGCTFDTGGCWAAPVCGNGTVEIGEACDGAVLLGNSCQDLGFTSGTLGCAGDCTDFDTSGCVLGAICGDAMVNQLSEQCDVADLDGMDCTTVGNFTGGALACAIDCSFDTAACIAAPACGDGVLNGAEICDGADVGSAACTDVGYSGGTLGCAADCMAFDFGPCTGSAVVCGNDLVEGLEECDGTTFETLGGTDSCSEYGYSSGTLICDSGCRLDLDGCVGSPAGVCDDGVWEGLEKCDPNTAGGAPLGPDCADLGLGFNAGPTGCNADCTLDLSTCSGGTTPYCGDGTLNALEACDGMDFGALTCTDLGLGFTGGMLACTAGCQIDTSGCTGGMPACGDGVVEGWEQCDGANLNGATCASEGAGDGALGCDACLFDFSGCYACGNGSVEPGFEECDGVNLGGLDCTDFGYSGGSLACDADCLLDTSACTIDTTCVVPDEVGFRRCVGNVAEMCQADGTWGMPVDCTVTGEICVSDGYGDGNCEPPAIPAGPFEICQGTGQANCDSADLYCGQVLLISMDETICITDCTTDPTVCDTITIPDGLGGTISLPGYCDPGLIDPSDPTAGSFATSPFCYPVGDRNATCFFNDDGCTTGMTCMDVSPGINPLCKLACSGADVGTMPAACAGETCLAAPIAETEDDGTGGYVYCAADPTVCDDTQGYACGEIQTGNDAVGNPIIESVCYRFAGVCGAVAPSAPALTSADDIYNPATGLGWIATDTNTCEMVGTDQYCATDPTGAATAECVATGWVGTYAPSIPCTGYDDDIGCFGLGVCLTLDGFSFQCAVQYSICQTFCTPADGSADVSCPTSAPNCVTPGFSVGGPVLETDANGDFVCCPTTPVPAVCPVIQACDGANGFTCDTTTYSDAHVCAKVRNVCTGP